MAENTKIEWAHHTFNPWIGCTKVSPGCANCYAEEMMDKRYGRAKWGKGQPRQRTSEANWKKPLQWNGHAAENGVRYRVFCSSLADVFDEEVPIEWLADLFALIKQTPHLDWLLLTKRPENIKKRIGAVVDHLLESEDISYDLASLWVCGSSPDNVWLGTSVENQEQAEKRIPWLLDVPAKIRFLSCEPLLGPLELLEFDVFYPLELINWVIVGGESGAAARPMALGWAKDVVHQCHLGQVSVFVKQMGDNPTNREGESCPHITAKKGNDMSEWPEELRVREVPA